MKTRLVLLLIFMCLIILTACVNNPIESAQKDSEYKWDEYIDDTSLAENNNLLLEEKDLDISIDGNIINYQMLKEEITSILGEPLEIIAYDGFENYTTYKYEGMEISFMGSYIDYLIIDSSSFPTYRGVSVGDSIEKMFDSYGKGNPVDSIDNQRYYMYSFLHDGIEIQLFFVEEQGNIIEYYFCNSL